MVTLQVDDLRRVLDRLGVEDSINSFPLADILTKPLDIYRSHLAEILVQLTECKPQVAYDAIQEPNDFGDLEVVIPRLRLKGSNPKELAFELAQKFPETPLFDQPFDDGIHLRLFISPGNLARILLPYILDRGKSYGSSSSLTLTDSDLPDGARTRVIIEFSSPNLGQEFDGAHLRSTIIGSSIASLYDGMGWDVCRLNFLGDWGKHIGLLAVGWSRFGSNELFEVEPLRHLLTVYTKIDDISKTKKKTGEEISMGAGSEGEAPLDESVPVSVEQDNFFKKMEDGDADAIALWRRLREVCVAEYENLYAQLIISFDDYSGESEVSQSTIGEVEAILREKGVYEENNGAWIIDFKKYGSKGLGTVTARHSNGTTSYLLRDVGAVLERRKNYNFDKMIYVVSARQDTHFQQLLRTLELMGDGYHELAQTLQHVNFGKVQGLSPRPGSAGLLFSDILEQCQKAMQESLEADRSDDFLQSYRVNGDGALNGANEFARLALMSQELSTKRSNTLNFTLGADEKIPALIDHYPGLTVQRWLDRLRSKGQDIGVGRNLEDEELDCMLFDQEEPYADMLRLIARFPNIVKLAFERLEPSIILSYLLQVTDMLPSVWDEDQNDAGFTELGVEHENAGEGSASRVESSQSYKAVVPVFYKCIRTALENGMNLIGLVPIKERTQEPAGVAEAADVAELQEVNEGGGPTTIMQEINEKLAPADTQPAGNEDLASTVALQSIDESALVPAVTQEENEELTLRSVQEEVDMAAPEAVPQDVSEDPAHQALPEEVPEEVHVEAVSTPIAQEVNDEGALEVFQDVSEDATPTALPEVIQEDHVEAVGTAVLQEVSEE